MSEAGLKEAWQLHRAGDYAGAERLYREVLHAEPANFDALFKLAFLCGERGQMEQAQTLLGEALKLDPKAADAHFLRGSALLKLDRSEEAVVCFDRAIALKPLFAEALFNRAVALMRLRRYEEAAESAGRSISIAPDYPNAHATRAAARKALGRDDEAMASAESALALDPNCLDALLVRGTILSQRKNYEAAAADCERALALDPALEYMPGSLAFFRMQCCDWRNLYERQHAIEQAIGEEKRAIQPFMNLAMPGSPARQLQCAQIWTRHECPPSAHPLWQGGRYRHDRIRVAYLSEDFRDHPVARQIAGVLEHHDTGRFEIMAVSLGAGDRGALRKRVERARVRFVDRHGQSDAETAKLLYESEIDICVDLTGFTGQARSGILPRRPAPVQASFLGFPGTMGASYIDYLVADEIVIPEGDRRHYSEKIVYLPGCFMPTDGSRAVAEHMPGRIAWDLPEAGFVFASFNGPQKISPAMFDIWMRILHAVEGSVLWLTKSNPAAMRNLASEAKARDVDPRRLIFAQPLRAAEEYLARLRLADLFLDTLPFNAHSTAADALQAGLPVLTSPGRTFAGRVAASLLQAAGLSEMIAPSLKDYEVLATRLARDPSALSAIKAKLAANRITSPLFDTERFTRNLEGAYMEMHKRAIAGRLPESFTVFRTGAGSP